MPVRGYAKSTSVKAGGTIGFCLSAKPPGLMVALIRPVGSSDETTGSLFQVNELPDPPPREQEPWLGFNWSPVYPFTISSATPSGIYELAAGPDAKKLLSVAQFVVRPLTPGSTSKILLLVDYITPAAYNSEGFKNLYDRWSGGALTEPRASSVSFDRPFRSRGYELTLAHWFNTNGIAVEYASTLDLHASRDLLDSYDCVVLGHHGEYWTKEMRDNLETFVAKGGNVVSLSGNAAFRQVRLDESMRMLTCFKNSTTDSCPDMERRTVAFAAPPVNRPPNSMTGAGFNNGAWGGPPVGYTLCFPTHWTMAGVAGSEIPAFMSYETDAAPFAVEDEGYPRVTGEEGTPLSTVILGRAECAEWSKPGGATMSLYVRNGMVFHAGTTDWIRNLMNVKTGEIDRITRNVVTRLKSRRKFDWEPIGTANNVGCMAAADNKLFAGSGGRLLRRYPVLADVVFTDVGSVNAVALAGAKGRLFALDGSNLLWTRPPIEADVAWTRIGEGPPVSGAPLALAGLGSALYAVAADGTLWSRLANTSVLSWKRVIHTEAKAALLTNASIRCMTSYNGILLAATTNNRLIRTNFDIVEESTGWTDVWSCNDATALAVIDNMLFVTQSSQQIAWLDLLAPEWASKN
jgi:hypothetical protein